MNSLTAYTALQNTTSTDLGFMPEFVAASQRCLDAYKDYYESSTTMECIFAFYELGKLAEKHGVEFELAQYQLNLFTIAEEEYHN